MGLEFRDGLGEVIGLDDHGDTHEVTVEFPLETVDSFRTVFLGDTFRDTIQQRMPAYVWMHNLRDPIGRATDAQVVDRERKIQVRNRFSRFGSFNPNAERAYWQIKDDEVREHSFGFERLAPLRPWTGQRGAMAVTRAIMRETSPVTIGSIPGAGAVDIREEGGLSVVETSIETPTRAEIMELRAQGIIDEDEARRLLVETLPDGLREHITLNTRQDPSGGGAGGDGGGDDTPSDPGTVAQSLDAVLDAAQAIIEDVADADGALPDSWPDEAKQVAALALAAGGQADDLLDALGIDDPDDGAGDFDDDEMRALLDELELRADSPVSNKPWSDFTEADYSPGQWKTACLIDTGTGDEGSKDRYKLPVLEPDGTLNRNGVHAAASVLAGGRGGVQAPDEAKKSAANRLLGLYSKIGDKAPAGLMRAAGKSMGGTETRSVDPDEEAAALAKLERRLTRR